MIPFAKTGGKYSLNLIIIILAALTPVLLPAIAPFPAQAQTATTDQKTDSGSTGDSQNGKKLFTSYGCYECHGHQAEGTSVGGPRLGPKPIPSSAFLKYVRQPSGQMPPYTAKVISDAELSDIYAFLQSLPQPPKADSIPALR
jgi:mono/diheme cytochrome c family protein